MSTVTPTRYCPNCGADVNPDASRCNSCSAEFEGADSWKPVLFDRLSKAARREAASRARAQSRRPAGPRDPTAFLIAILVLGVAIFETGALGLVSIMSAENVWQWLVLTVLPTGIVPVVYFLTIHGMGPDSKRAYLGIGAAVTIFFSSWIIVIGGIGAWGVLVTLGVPEHARWPGYLLLLVLLTVQFLIFSHFRRRLTEHMNEDHADAL